LKALTTIGVAVAAICVSLLVSLVVTWLAYELLIPERAFHCNDGGIPAAFWTSADTHRTAGDKILPGWTWERLRLVNNTYELAFFGLSIAGAVVSFRISRSILRDHYPSEDRRTIALHSTRR
jgi:uncharacterized membrane protein YraQ (UPF0718 family)